MMLTPSLRAVAARTRLVFAAVLVPVSLSTPLLPEAGMRHVAHAGVAAVTWLFLLWAIWRFQAGGRAAWLWAAGGIALWGVGMVADAAYRPGPDAWGGIADAAWLSVYPMLYLSATQLLRDRGNRPDGKGVLDVLMITAAVYAFPGVLFVERILAGLGVPGHPKAIMIAYLMLDAGLFVLVAWILLTRAAAVPSFRWLAVALAMQLTGDLFAAWVGPSRMPAWVDATYLLGPIALTLAAMHVNPILPELRSLKTHRQIDRTWVLATLGCIALPVVGIVLGIRLQSPTGIVGGVVGLIVVLALSFSRTMLMITGVRRDLSQLNVLAFTDELTRLPNRRSILEFLESSRHADQPTSVALLDLDHFKRFNDTYGHDGGDDLLIAASAQWRRALGADGRIGRLGGEEFLVVLPGTRLDRAESILRRMHEVTPMGQTFSAGVAEVLPVDEVADVLKRADEALYRAKDAGRARTMTAVA